MRLLPRACRMGALRLRHQTVIAPSFGDIFIKWLTARRIARCDGRKPPRRAGANTWKPTRDQFRDPARVGGLTALHGLEIDPFRKVCLLEVAFTLSMHTRRVLDGDGERGLSKHMKSSAGREAKYRAGRAEIARLGALQRRHPPPGRHSDGNEMVARPTSAFAVSGYIFVESTQVSAFLRILSPAAASSCAKRGRAWHLRGRRDIL